MKGTEWERRIETTLPTGIDPADLKVDIPEGECAGLVIQRFVVSKEHASLDELRRMIHGEPAYRSVPPGTYTRLGDTVDHTLWMTDTPAEIMEHAPAIRAVRCGARTVLVTGLGLGVFVRWALRQDGVERIDVVEHDWRVIALVGPTMPSDERLHVHRGDAFTWTRPKDVRWEYAWHDIWPDVSAKNVPEMTRLKRRYRAVATAQGCWQEAMCRYMARV